MSANKILLQNPVKLSSVKKLNKVYSIIKKHLIRNECATQPSPQMLLSSITISVCLIPFTFVKE